MHPVILEHRTEVAVLCARFHVRRLALFGSAARSSGSEPRDFDLLVEFQTMPPVQHAESYFGLWEELEKLLRAPVDLVEPAAIRNPYFQRSVEATQVNLYAAA
jgi:uncharacterized protein